MMRDIFRRGTRMTHRFGPLEDVCDPLGTGHFTPKFPERLQEHRSPPIEIQQYGERQSPPQMSSVSKPSGAFPSLSGPEPDYGTELAMPIPVGTKRRYGPLKTDK